MTIYWAASLHGARMRKQNEVNADFLESRGHKVLLPQRHGIWEPMLKAEREAHPDKSEEECLGIVKAKCRSADMEDMDAANVCVVFAPHVPSEGAAWEAGYMYAQGKITFLLCENDAVYKTINLMLTENSVRVKSVIEIATCLQGVKEIKDGCKAAKEDECKKS